VQSVVVLATALTHAGGWPFARLVLIDTVGRAATTNNGAPPLRPPARLRSDSASA
jgi:hypothetical protein